MSKVTKSNPRNPRSRWLLWFIAQRTPGGICGTTRMPPDHPGVSMCTVRGLQRSGFLVERNGIFALTEMGRQVAIVTSWEDGK